MKTTVKFNVYSTRLVKESENTYESSGEKCSNPVDAARILDQVFELSYSPEERGAALFFDTKMRVVGASLLSIGDIAETILSPRSLMRTALLMNASSVIIAHNHPSGDVTPSSSDYGNFERIKQSGEIMAVAVSDSIVLCDGKGYSLAANEHFYY